MRPWGLGKKLLTGAPQWRCASLTSHGSGFAAATTWWSKRSSKKMRSAYSVKTSREGVPLLLIFSNFFSMSVCKDFPYSFSFLGVIVFRVPFTKTAPPQDRTGTLDLWSKCPPRPRCFPHRLSPDARASLKSEAWLARTKVARVESAKWLLLWVGM
ncbi:unnamed protein product [Trypanosoma congolense IL3000]|uniref:WGS project CAEQ00000000 data, annotated contig 1648 n=1 Tax=Trypanosoma congolense (strain IL3000) TaxID=1068625 RepID=F9W7S4_TRYCI|nr:unnamed protein product [Trypanosoma congolense IL3000]